MEGHGGGRDKGNLLQEILTTNTSSTEIKTHDTEKHTEGRDLYITNHQKRTYVENMTCILQEYICRKKTRTSYPQEQSYL